MTYTHFTAPIEIREGNPYVLVTADVVQKIKANWRRPLPVLIQVNGEPREPWHINMMPVGNGDFYLYLHGDVRTASKTGVGDVVEVAVKFDADYKNGPQHPMPAWFEKALTKNATAQTNWQKLRPSRQKEILRYFAGLKSEEAIARNLQKAMKVLSGQADRFMARSWQDGE